MLNLAHKKVRAIQRPWGTITLTKIRAAARKIATTVQPEKIILFGSFAYGNPTPDSDVDLLVIMESRQSVHVRSAQVSDILYPRPFPVDIIVRTPAEIAERVKTGDEFYCQILIKGKLLYERPTH